MLEVSGLSRSFGAHRAVDDVSLSVAPGEFFALLGPSGCGKTTLLRLIAGFEPADAGRVLIDGQDVTEVPPHRRPTNMMFQSYALFPHLTVAQNIGFGLRQEKLPAGEIAARVEQMLALVRLDGLGGRKPHQLSGGQRQRVALARALAKQPKLLLLDEPLSALDRKLREETRAELIAVQRRLGTAFVMVTHDQEEAMAIADRVAVMLAGRVAQIGPPAEVYARPSSRAVASFLGEVNLIEVGQLAALGVAPLADTTGKQAWIGIRPERMTLGEGPIAATVESVTFLGDRWLVRARAGDVALAAVVVAPAPPAMVGAPIRLGWPADAATVMTA